MMCGSASSVLEAPMSVITSSEQREFFVWVPPAQFLVQHNLGRVGSFRGGPLEPEQDAPKFLPFQPNEKEYGMFITPFNSSVMNNYRLEYWLDAIRYDEFNPFPSRLHALYLLDSEHDANVYAATHPGHVDGRILKRCITEGRHLYSRHDSAWIEFLREAHSLDADTINCVARWYWSGQSVDDYGLVSMGREWRKPSSPEILYYGRVDFPDKSLDGPGFLG